MIHFYDAPTAMAALNTALLLSKTVLEIDRLCGFAGFVDLSPGSDSGKLRSVATRMAETLRHRGPDDAGAWADESAGVALGHRRLSIIDLSEHGRQPMVSHSGRYVIAYNGEVYNFRQLRGEIDNLSGGAPWAGHSDTEVMLAAFDLWGIEEAVKRFRGMFAFAVWDNRERTISLARDRIGKKPLYYGWSGNSFLFGSELKALRAHPGFSADVDRASLTLLLRYGYIISPYTIYQNVHKLTPGSILTLDGNTIRGDRFSPMPEWAEEGYAAPKRYWSARSIFMNGADDPISVGDDEAADQLESILKEATGMRMISDVPLGALLSGGVDSSLTVSLMQEQSDRPVRTFTIGFHEKEFDEAGHARAIAERLGTEHTELYLSPKAALDTIPDLPKIFDEPFADSSLIPTYLVSKLARENVTVALSGDGGDELFGGYHRYMRGEWFYRKSSNFPVVLRKLASHAMEGVSAHGWNRLFKAIERLLPEDMRQPNAGDKIHKLARIMADLAPENIYRQLVSQWDDAAEIVKDGREPATVISDEAFHTSSAEFANRLMLIDLMGYLPDDIMAKVDRASMAVSLETRAPILDHRVAEFAARAPVRMKIRDGKSKWLLRKILYRRVPEELIERPKRGFSAPVADWLRGPLRDWAEALLDEGRLSREGYFNPAPIREKWNEHRDGAANWRNHLWNVLMFQAWLEEYGE